MLAIALAEQQPMPLLAIGDPRLEQAAQPGQAGAVAQQNHRYRLGWQVETAVAPNPQADAATYRCVLGQPAGADAQATVRVHFLTHDQFQDAVGGDRGDGVFAHGQRHQCIHQRLGMQADQVRAVLRQLATGQGLLQGLCQAIEGHGGSPVYPQTIEEVLDHPRAVTRQYLHQVTGEPAAGSGGSQAQQVDRRTAAVRVHQFAAGQRPVVVAGCLPGVQGRLSGQLAELLLPVTQGVGVAAVDFHRGEQRLAAMLAQPGVQASGESAKVLILPITEAQHRIVQAVQAHGATQHLALETPGAVRRFAVAKGTDHEQRVARILQVLLADTGQWLHFHRQAGGLQLPGGLPGQLFGKAALAGEPDQPGRGVGRRLGKTVASVSDVLFLASTVEVQQPAGDEEQRHGQGTDGQDHPPDNPEVTADMQGVNAGQQLRLEALVAVAVMPLDDAGGGIEGDLVQGAVVG